MRGFRGRLNDWHFELRLMHLAVVGLLPRFSPAGRYGSGDPKIVFVERKTHRESWKGEESVKERIVLPEENVVPFLEQTYTVEQAVDDLRAKVCMARTVQTGLSCAELAPGQGALLPMFGHIVDGNVSVMARLDQEA